MYTSKIPWIAFGISISITIIIWGGFLDFEDRLQSSKFKSQTSEISSVISDRLKQYEQVLMGARAFLSSSKEVSPMDWKNFVEIQMITEYPDIQGIGFAKHVIGEKEANKLINQMRDYGIDNFTITTENRTSEYYPVIYLEPQNDRNKRAIGYDTYSEKLRKIAIDSAIESGRGTLSGKIILVQEIDEDVQNGFLLMMPVFSSGKNSPEENNPMSVIGMVNGVFRINDFVEGLFGKHQFEYIHMRIYDQIEIPENLFFDSKEFYEYETREVDFSSKHNLEFGSRSWIIIYEGTAPPLNSVERVVSIFLPIAGFGMSGLLFYVFYLGDKNLQLIKNSLKNEKITTVGKLSANLAHDLRNPLSIITGCLYLLSRYSENSDEKNKNLISKSNVAVKKMNEQINDVLNFVSSRKLQLSEVSLKELINKPGILPEIPDNINLNLPQNDILLNCDKLKIEVLINNMIINSIQAIGEKTGTITIRLSEDQKNAVIEVIDSGPGISKNNMKEIFEPLFSTKSKGIGLGLASCEHIVKSHRGKIIVKNKPTKFTILIPK